MEDAMRRIGDKPLTNAEKQKRLRDRRKSQGLHRIQAWSGRDGFIGNPTEKGTYAQITMSQFSGELKKLTPDYENWEREIVLAELLEQAKMVIKRYNKVRQNCQEDIVNEEMVTV
jgi:hypothetical protein